MSVGIGRERQFEIYVGGARGMYPAVPVSIERLEAAARKRMSAEGYAYIAGGAGTEETMRENRAGFERWRIVPRMLRDVSTREPGRRRPRDAVGEPLRALPDRRPRDGPSRRGRRGREGGRGRGHPVRLLQPGVAPDGGDGTRDGRRPALVPALLEHLERARREPRLAGGAAAAAPPSSSRSTRRCSAGGSAISTSARCRSSAARASRSTRATPCSWTRCRRRSARTRRPAGASRSRRSRRCWARRARIPGRGWRTCARASRARRYGASSRRTRGRRCRGTTSRSSVSGRGCRSC